MVPAAGSDSSDDSDAELDNLDTQVCLWSRQGSTGLVTLATCRSFVPWVQQPQHGTDTSGLPQAIVGNLEESEGSEQQELDQVRLARCQAAMRTLNYSPKLAEGGAEAAPTGSSQGAQSSTAPGSDAFR